MIDINRSIEILSACSVCLSHVRTELVEEWDPDPPPPTVMMSAMARALVLSAERLPEGELSSASGCIERLLETGTEEVQNAVATGFLEAIVAAQDLAQPGAATVRAVLGPRAQEYCAAWDEFTAPSHRASS